MIDKTSKITITRQAELLNINRTTLYYVPKPMNDNDLQTLRKLDELHLQYPFMGSRMLQDQLNRQGIEIGRLHTKTLMNIANIHAISRQKPISEKHALHKIYPYLLRNVPVTRPNQVWATDITYIPMKRGFVYLVAILDWFSRKVLALKISINMETDFILDALKEAMTRYGKPEIFNTDQGSQFTSEAFTSVLKENKILISMDGKGAWRDNVFVERLWKSVKYEEVYLKAYETVAQARQSLNIYFQFYNTKRPHSSLDKQTPDEAYFNNLQPIKIAA
jgi:putative transposase